MYEDEARFDRDGTAARKIKRVLNYMARVLRSEPPEMDIKWGFVDLYLLISTLDSDYDLRGRHDDVLNFYVSFEQERRGVEDPVDLVGPGHDSWERDLYDYIEAFQREGGKRANLETRHGVYVRRALRDIPDLVPKDPTRAFRETSGWSSGDEMARPARTVAGRSRSRRCTPTTSSRTLAAARPQSRTARRSAATASAGRAERQLRPPES